MSRVQKKPCGKPTAMFSMTNPLLLYPFIPFQTIKQDKDFVSSGNAGNLVIWSGLVFRIWLKNVEVVDESSVYLYNDFNDNLLRGKKYLTERKAKLQLLLATQSIMKNCLREQFPQNTNKIDWMCSIHLQFHISVIRHTKNILYCHVSGHIHTNFPYMVTHVENLLSIQIWYSYQTTGTNGSEQT